MVVLEHGVQQAAGAFSGQIGSSRMLRDQSRSFPPSISAERSATLIAKGLDRGRDAFFVPWWWGLIAVALRVLPTWLFKRVAPG